MVDPLVLILKNYLNLCNQNFRSHCQLFLNFSVLTCESDYYILQFLNKLNLTYQRLTSFVASFYFIPIVLVPWGKFLLCHTPITPFFGSLKSDLNLDCGFVTTWSLGSYQLPTMIEVGHTLGLKTNEQLQWKRREKKKEKKKKSLEAYRSSDYNIIDTIEKISKRWIQQHQRRSPIMIGENHTWQMTHLILDRECDLFHSSFYVD